MKRKDDIIEWHEENELVRRLDVVEAVLNLADTISVPTYKVQTSTNIAMGSGGISTKADRKTENSSEKPNNLERSESMTEEQFNEWLKTQPLEDKLVYLKYKYAHEDEWTFSNEILEVDMSVDGYYIWSHDWDEGQQDVEILGCIAISDIDVPVFTQADTPQTDCHRNGIKTEDGEYIYECIGCSQTDCAWK